MIKHPQTANTTRVIIASPGIGYGFGCSPFYYSPFGYPFGYPHSYSNTYKTSSRLQMKIEDIKSDYKDKIWLAKHDTTLSKDERKKIVQQLKIDREKAVQDTKVNYYKSQRPAPAPAATSNG